jgi:hypothetical protein
MSTHKWCSTLLAVTFASAGGNVAAQSLDWARQAGGGNFDEATAVAVDSDGNSLVAGMFRSEIVTFGAGQPNATTLTSIVPNGQDMAEPAAFAPRSWSRTPLASLAAMEEESCRAHQPSLAWLLRELRLASQRAPPPQAKSISCMSSPCSST